MQKLGRKGRKKWGNVSPTDHPSYEEIKNRFELFMNLSDGWEPGIPGRETIHLSRCKKCRKILDGFRKRLFMAIHEYGVRHIEGGWH